MLKFVKGIRAVSLAEIVLLSFGYYKQTSGVGLFLSMPKFEKYLQNLFRSTGLFRGGHDFLGQALYQSKKIVQNKGIWVFKNAEFYVDFSNINLP
jgi:hypothetical protein